MRLFDYVSSVFSFSVEKVLIVMQFLYLEYNQQHCALVLGSVEVIFSLLSKCYNLFLFLLFKIFNGHKHQYVNN